MLLTLAEICKRYLGGVPVGTASNYKSRAPGFPVLQRGKRYDVKEVLEFYAANLPHTYKVWREARRSLAKWDAPPVQPEQSQKQPEKPEQQPERQPEQQPEQPQEQHAPDFEAQLEQLRWACVRAFERWQTLDGEQDSDPVAVSHALKSYTTTQETLRRAEMDNVELQKKRGEVLLTADVQAAVSRLIGNTLQKLTQLPQLLAPQLKGLASQARIKKILEDEIRKVVNGLQERPF